MKTWTLSPCKCEAERENSQKLHLIWCQSFSTCVKSTLPEYRVFQIFIYCSYLAIKSLFHRAIQWNCFLLWSIKAYNNFSFHRRILKTTWWMTVVNACKAVSAASVIGAYNYLRENLRVISWRVTITTLLQETTLRKKLGGSINFFFG